MIQRILSLAAIACCVLSTAAQEPPKTTTAPNPAGLLPHGTITGTVKSVDGSPLADVEVSYPEHRMPLGEPVATSTHTDAKGDYKLQAPLGTVTLTFSKAGYVSETATVTLKAEPAHSDQTMVKATSISGRVVDDEGKPVGEARVRASSTTPKPDTKDTTTDAEGKFTFTGLRPAEYKFEASRRAYVTSSQSVKLPAKSVSVTIPRGATVRGIVHNSEAGERAFVVVYIGPVTTGINDKEEFGLLGVPGGTLKAYAEFQSEGKLRRTPVKEIKTTPGGETHVELGFVPEPVLRGKVLEKEKPVARALITLKPAESSRLPITFVTDETGSFEAIGVPEGEYSVSVRDREMFSGKTLRQKKESTLDISVGPAPKPKDLRPELPPPPAPAAKH